MRLIDADALLEYLADIELGITLMNEFSLHENDLNKAVLDGLVRAEEAVMDAPTVYASDWMNEMMIEAERIKKEQNDDTDTEDSEIPE